MMESAQLLVSDATLGELADVLSRSKFDPYIGREDREEFFQRLTHVAEIVPIVSTIRACRDSGNDKFLEVAADGGATLIVTGDKDVLALSPFRTIGIVTPAQAMVRLPDEVRDPAGPGLPA